MAGMLAVNLTSIISLLPTEAIRRCHFGGCPQGETRLLCWDAFSLLVFWSCRQRTLRWGWVVAELLSVVACFRDLACVALAVGVVGSGSLPSVSEVCMGGKVAAGLLAWSPVEIKSERISSVLMLAYLF